MKYNEEQNVLYLKLSGQLSKEAILSVLNWARSDEKYKKSTGRIWDFREADLSSVDAMTIIEMAQYPNEFPTETNDVKVALVASADLEYGLGRMFEMATESSAAIQVFRSIAKAEDWLAR